MKIISPNMNLNFNEICRLCFRFCREYIDLSQTNGFKASSTELIEKIQFCYFIQMDFSDGLPTKICYECIQVVTFFYIAKKNIIISEELLRYVLSVRKKLQERTAINRDKSVTSSINNIKPVKEKNTENSSLASDNLNNLDPNSTKLFNIELSYDKQPVDDFNKNRTATDLGKRNSVTPTNDITGTNLENGFRLENKKEQASLLLNSRERDLGLLLNDPNNELVLSFKFKDVKKLRNQDRKYLEMAKGLKKNIMQLLS